MRNFSSKIANAFSLRSLVKRRYKKIFSTLVFSGILAFYIWLVFAASHATLPDSKNPIQFYSNQARNDIKLTFYQTLKEAKQSIFLSFYGVSDPEILSLLRSKAEENLLVRVEFDPSASANLKKILPSSVQLCAIKSKGLMHRKIAVVDQSRVYLGSANLTTTSLRHHANLVLGLYSNELAAFLENPSTTSLAFKIQDQKAEIYLQPDPEKLGLVRLMALIAQAQRKINIAMFTFTHPVIADALIKAKKRGVEITIAVDYYTAKGASKKTLAKMEQEGVRIVLSQGRELLHHKWAFIDEEVLVMGSANWTKAAFTKNHDFLLFLFFLTKNQINFLSKLWETIEAESIPNIETNQAA